MIRMSIVFTDSNKTYTLGVTGDEPIEEQIAAMIEAVREAKIDIDNINCIMTMEVFAEDDPEAIVEQLSYSPDIVKYVDRLLTR